MRTGDWREAEGNSSFQRLSANNLDGRRDSAVLPGLEVAGIEAHPQNLRARFSFPESLLKQTRAISSSRRDGHPPTLSLHARRDTGHSQPPWYKGRNDRDALRESSCECG